MECTDCGKELKAVDADYDSERGWWPLYEECTCEM